MIKKFVIALMIATFLPISALAECDFKTGITKTEGGYLYTRECHIKVGEMKQDLEIEVEKTAKLTKALELKDLAITRADQRADLWMNTSFKLEDRVNTIDEMRKTNQWLYFGLGVVTMFAASYAASQLNHGR